MRFPEFTEEWRKYKLSEICSFFSGGTPSSSKKEYYDGSIPFIRSGELHEDQTELFITEDGLKNSAAKMVEVGDLLLALYGATSGDIAISKINGAINQAILCIRTEQHKKFIESIWYKHVGKLLQTYLQGGQGNLSADIVKNISFYFAAIEEQKKLAEFIALLDERIATQNKIIEKLETLIKALSATIFNSLQGPLILLSKVASIKKGQQLNGTELEECGRYYVMNGGVVPSGYYNEYNTEANTISISEGGNSCGYVQFNTLPFWSGGHCYTLCDIKSELINPKYLYHYLKYKEQNIMALRIGSGLPNIQKKALEQFGIKLPDMTMQNRIAIALDTITKKIDVENRIKKSYQVQKSYLLSNLFI
ncbi:restriction endonuclease subunit S [uncultured Alistipes sp.]|nr:restriction endonuclease subunit S [uncultured Alistipes sp.]